jgi:hypothetical protein
MEHTKSCRKKTTMPETMCLVYIYSKGTPFSLITKHTKQTVETYKIYIFKKWVCDEGSAKVG